MMNKSLYPANENMNLVAKPGAAVFEMFVIGSKNFENLFFNEMFMIRFCM